MSLGHPHLRSSGDCSRCGCITDRVDGYDSVQLESVHFIDSSIDLCLLNIHFFIVVYKLVEYKLEKSTWKLSSIVGILDRDS